MKSPFNLFICISLLSLVFGCVSSTQLTTDEQTVMLHWLDQGNDGHIRLVGGEGNATEESPVFTGRAIETFEQSPTKSISSWHAGKRHGFTTEYYYNGRKRREISFYNGERDGPSREYRMTGELLREENYRKGKLNGVKAEWFPNGNKAFAVELRDEKPHGEALEWHEDGRR